MKSKLILKLKVNKEIKNSMIMKSGDGVMQVDYAEGSNILVTILGLIGTDSEEINKLLKSTDLKNLYELIQKGFVIRIDELTEQLRFTAYIDKASTGVIVSKEQGISCLLKDAEDWAETMLEELNQTNSL